MSETPQDDTPDADLEEMRRGQERDKLYQNICAEIAKVQWKLVEEPDPDTALTSHVLLGSNDLPMWLIPHADKGVAALVVDALLVGVALGDDEVREQARETLKKLERWQPPSGKLD